LRTLSLAGAFKTIHPKGNADCKRLTGAFGVEDFVAIEGILLLASDSHCQLMETCTFATAPNGAIASVNLNEANPTIRPVKTVNVPSEFEMHPHGVDVYHGDDGQWWFAVVNHPSTGDELDVFTYDIDQNTITFQYRLRHPLMRHLNDVAFIDPYSFYTTNWHWHEIGSFKLLLEKYGQMRWGYVLHCHTKANDLTVTECEMAYDGLSLPNGLQLSPDKKSLYLAVTTELSVYVFDRHDNNSLSVRSSVNVDSGVDNINLDEHGALWIASHPKLLTFVAHSSDPKNHHAPSQVLHLQPTESASSPHFKVTELFSSPGQDFSAATSALVYRDHMILSAILEDGLFICPRPSV